MVHLYCKRNKQEIGLVPSLTWLQFTLCKSILSRALGSVHLYQVSDKIHKHFTQTKAHARQLRTNLCATSLEGKTMHDFLSQIKNITDELAGVGSPIQHQEHVDAILEGLPPDYTLVVSVIESKFVTPPIAEVEVLLLAHESRSNRFSKKSFCPSMNYTQLYVNPNSSSHDCGGYTHRNADRSSYSDRSSGDGGGRCGGAGPNRGCGGQFANFQCQIYLKYGHTANICYYRSDFTYQPHESMVLYDPATLQHVQHGSSQSQANSKFNTGVNPANTKSQNQSVPIQAIPSAMLANSSSQENANSTWIPDSGASFHVTGEPQYSSAWPL